MAFTDGLVIKVRPARELRERERERETKVPWGGEMTDPWSKVAKAERKKEREKEPNKGRFSGRERGQREVS